MTETETHILLLEPYYGGSHRAFLDGMRTALSCRFTLLELPARKWKMRMQLAAPWMAERVIRMVRSGERFDLILASTFLDAATFRALLASAGLRIPLCIYFHENQFAYPSQTEDPGRFQFTALNFTSALAADAIAFNSEYNRETFLDGVAGYLKKATDMDIRNKVEEVRRKSVVLHPGIDFTGFVPPLRREPGEPPVVVWNHRWEHDKDPETFFGVMTFLAEEGKNFRLVVLGQHFERCPDVFATAQARLAARILHFGYVEDRREYARQLRRGDIVVSTAVHEFFGMAVLEAVRCGCRPLVPDRLSYPELFPAEYRYREGQLHRALSGLLRRPSRLPPEESRALTERYSWQSLAPDYEKWLVDVQAAFHDSCSNF